MSKQQTNETLRADMWRACDILRRDNNVGGVMQYTEHLAWLLFLKFLDEEEEKRKAEALLENKRYEAVLLDGELAWNHWAGPEKVKGWDAAELIQFVRGRLLPGLSTLSGSPLARTIARIFSDESAGDQNVVRSVPVCASGHNLKDVLQIINTIRFESDTDVYTISQVYEDLLERVGAENRIAGEFYTPRPVIGFMVEVIAPQVGETVYDPACGSAGFLVDAFQFTNALPNAQPPEADQILQHQTYFGQEKNAFHYMLGIMNLVLHGVSSHNINRANTLEECMIDNVSALYDIIFNHPPFGGTEGWHIQQNFPVKSNATELLFLEHILKKLKRTPNARAAVIVPEGTLFRGGAFAEVKKKLLEQFHLFAVVSLPPGTFAPYSDVKTALLFFQRPDLVLEYNPQARCETWYYELPLPEGLKKFSKGSKIQTEHFAAAQVAWQQWQGWLAGSADRPFPLATAVRQAWEQHYVGQGAKPTGPYNTWVETLNELKARSYDLSARNPNQDDRVQLPHPAEITARLLERTCELHSILENLHEMVSNGSGEEIK